jgi:hypothetical protein
MSDPTDAEQRETLIAGMADIMRTMQDKEIASRVVGMLIMVKGNLNGYQTVLDIAFAAHSRARSAPQGGAASALDRWTVWQGGDFLPVPPETRVTVRLRDGSLEGPAKASDFAGLESCWKHRGSGGDIVAYTSAFPSSQSGSDP